MKNKKPIICILSQQHFSHKHVSRDCINAFEEALLRNQEAEFERVYVSEFIFKVNRKIKKNLLSDWKIIRNVRRQKPDYLFVIAMSVNDLYYLAGTLNKINIPKIAYCFDTWEATMDKWKAAVTTAGVEYVLCAYKRSVEKFKGFVKKSSFVPQAMNEKIFFPKSVEKNRLFMQMGRKNKKLHEYVLKYMQENNLPESEYVFERVPGEIIFPEFEELATEMCKSWFFICAPRNLDEQKFTGDISEVTARYYEGMACKTLIVGFKPQDTFDELFPNENAMIEITDYKSFSKAVNYFLNNKKEYERIVNENYCFLIENHTWDHRANDVVQFIRNLGI